MDNQFENEFNGAEPQRPLTEKQSPPAEEPAANAFEPLPDTEPLELPLDDPGYEAEEPRDPGFNPIQHTAVYANNRFFGEDAEEYPEPDDEEEDFLPDPDFYAEQGEPPFVPQEQEYYPPQEEYYTPQHTYAQPIPTVPVEQNKGVNKALLAVIIALGALLTVSLVGLVGYSLTQAKPAPESSSDLGGLQDLVPGFTLPDSGGSFGDSPAIPQTTQPAVEHKESDYSDQINKDYEGLKLEEKPDENSYDEEEGGETPVYSTESAVKAQVDSVASVLCYSGSADGESKVDTQGSGIIITADGYVVTNAHVVGNSKTAYAIKVETADGKSYTAGVVGFDARTDLAVLKLDGAKDLKPATFVNSDSVELGEDLLIIGNPGGIEYRNSVTKGIVSAINRDASSKNIVKYIQTDAAINPGSSGGPAVNRYGQVVGVASAKIVDEKYEGIGFCIPSTQVKTTVDSLIRAGYVEGRTKIGVSGVALTASEAELYSLPRGIEVSSVTKDGPCDNTDLKEGDIITALDGAEITSFADIYNELEKHKPGDKVKLSFYRKSDGANHEIEIVLQEDK